MVSSRQPFIIYQLEWYSPVEYQCHVNNNMWCSHTLAIDHCSTWTTYPIQLVLTKGRQAVLNRSIDLDRESYLRQRVSPPWNNKNKGPTWDRAPPPAVTNARPTHHSLDSSHRLLIACWCKDTSPMIPNNVETELYAIWFASNALLSDISFPFARSINDRLLVKQIRSPPDFVPQGFIASICAFYNAPQGKQCTYHQVGERVWFRNGLSRCSVPSTQRHSYDCYSGNLLNLADFFFVVFIRR